jgi:hypothetical protein
MIESTSIIPVENQERIKKALEFCESLTQIKINSQEQYDNAVAICKQIIAGLNSLENDRKALTGPLDKKMKSINAEYKIVTSKFGNAERVIRNGMETFFQEKERIRLEEQRKLEAEAEAKRKAAEEKAAAEQRKADAYREQGREDLAAKAEARAETAETIAATVTAPIVENTAKGSGVSYRTVWEAVIEDQNAAILFCANNSILSSYVTLDINGLIRLCAAQKGNLQVSGIRFIEKKKSNIRT